MNIKLIQLIPVMLLLFCAPNKINGEKPRNEHDIIPVDNEIVGGIEYFYFKSKNRADRNNIYIVDSLTGDKELIYSTDRGYVDNVSLSPNRKYIAALEPVMDTVTRLIILNPSGEILHALYGNVKLYDWSPDGYKIAYITGGFLDEGVGMKPTGVYVFDLNDSTKTRITKDFPHRKFERYKGGGHNLRWARHDGNLYIVEVPQAGGNYMYDPRTGKTTQVSHKGIYFSPDGKYYFSRPAEDFPRMYVTATDEDISERIKSRFGHLPTGWIPDKPHHVRVLITEYEKDPKDTTESKTPRVWIKGTRKITKKTFYIYNVAHDEIEKEWTEIPEK